MAAAYSQAEEPFPIQKPLPAAVQNVTPICGPKRNIWIPAARTRKRWAIIWTPIGSRNRKVIFPTTSFQIMITSSLSAAFSSIFLHGVTSRRMTIHISRWDQTGGNGMIHIGGFPPVERKYTKEQGGKHEGVPTEWHFAEIYSCFNAYMDADIGSIADIANASVYQHYPLAPQYAQKLPTIDDLKERGYITGEGKVAPKFYAAAYVGDYDSTGWIYQRIPDLWGDPARGSVPLGWAFNPNLSDRFAPGLVYARRKSSSNDSFVAGDSGAGYVNPMNLVEPRKWSGLPSGLDVWTRHCQKYYKLWDISVTGFIIDGYAAHTSGKVEEAYTTFSPNGLGLQYGKGWGVYHGTPFIQVEESIQYHNPE